MREPLRIVGMRWRCLAQRDVAREPLRIPALGLAGLAAACAISSREGEIALGAPRDAGKCALKWIEVPADTGGMSTDLDARERRELRRKARAATLEALEALGGEGQRAVIHEVALASGGFTPRELAARPPGRPQNSYERLVEQQLSRTLTELKRDGLVENPSRGTWRLTGAALEPVAAAVQRPAPREKRVDFTPAMAQEAQRPAGPTVSAKPSLLRRLLAR